MEKRPCDVADLIEQSAELMRDMAENSGVTLVTSPLPACLWADPDRIMQILTNLLSNAIKFSSEGGTVELTAQPRGEHILFRVRDQGRGIPADKLETIFERFEQVDASDSRVQGRHRLGTGHLPQYSPAARRVHLGREHFRRRKHFLLNSAIAAGAAGRAFRRGGLESLW